MLTTNIDINDKLINGQMGTVTKIALVQNTNKTCVVYVKFDDSQAGIKAIDVQITMLEKTLLYPFNQ